MFALKIILIIIGISIGLTIITAIVESIFKKKREGRVYNVVDKVPSFNATIEYISHNYGKSVLVDFHQRKVCVVSGRKDNPSTYVYDYKDLVVCKILDKRKEVKEQRSTGKEILGAAMFGFAGAYFARAAYSISGFTGSIEMELDVKAGERNDYTHSITFFSTNTPQPFGEFYYKTCEATLLFLYINYLISLADLERGNTNKKNQLLKLIYGFKSDLGLGLKKVFKESSLSSDEIIVTVYSDFCILTNKTLYLSCDEPKAIRLSDIKNIDSKFQGGWHFLNLELNSGSIIHLDDVMFPNYFPNILKFIWKQASIPTERAKKTEDEVNKVSCEKCGAKILPQTYEKYLGLCAPCGKKAKK